jgi:hypothetical protein
MQIDHGLLYGLKHLSLHSQHLLKSRQRGLSQVSIIVVVLTVVIGGTVPCVDHLKYEC